jgi:phage gp36-like protein
MFPQLICRYVVQKNRDNFEIKGKYKAKVTVLTSSTEGSLHISITVAEPP